MIFKVVTSKSKAVRESQDVVFLGINNWNDYAYLTVFDVVYMSAKNGKYNLGNVRIGSYGQEIDERKLVAGAEFTKIGDEFFSLGAGTDYYEELKRIPKEIREEILIGLNDIAFSDSLFEKAKDEEVTQVSLMRDLNVKTVIGQYRRMSKGGAKLTKYNFQYTVPKTEESTPELVLNFRVKPDSNPPTNLHIIIGRNGVGKTYLMNSMIENLLSGKENIRDGFHFEHDIESNGSFVNLVFISFSAFDRNNYTSSHQNNIRFKYLGLKKNDDQESGNLRVKTDSELEDEFVSSLAACLVPNKRELLNDSLNILASDPNFQEPDILHILTLNEKDLEEFSRTLFNSISSGHKIILLTIIQLIVTLQEKSLVLIDEPEAHLHPPLLSAFTRCLSELLIRVNGVSIITTHSPVVLQEVPKKCVYILRRHGSQAFAERPEIECFGENVGVLTREVFGLEVTDSGFYQLLANAVDEIDSYEELLDHFGNQLGMEAKSLARVLFANKKSRDK